MPFSVCTECKYLWIFSLSLSMRKRGKKTLWKYLGSSCSLFTNLLACCPFIGCCFVSLIQCNDTIDPLPLSLQSTTMKMVKIALLTIWVFDYNKKINGLQNIMYKNSDQNLFSPISNEKYWHKQKFIDSVWHQVHNSHNHNKIVSRIEFYHHNCLIKLSQFLCWKPKPILSNGCGEL